MVFAELQDTDLRRFLDLSTDVEKRPQDYLFREFEPAPFIYLLRDGEWMFERDLADGSRQVSGFSSSGELVGFGDDRTYAYSLVALTEGHARKISLNDFFQFVGDIPSLARALHERRNAVMFNMSKRASMAAKLKAHERLCVFLMKIFEMQKAETSVTLHMTRKDIADYLGLTSDTVSRGFKKLMSDGVISFDESARHIDILQLDSVRELANSL